VPLAKSPQSWQVEAKRSKSARKSAPKVDANAPKTALDAALGYASEFN
jgi:hypothetical protein